MSLEFYRKLSDGGAGWLNVLQFSADPGDCARQHSDAYVKRKLSEVALLLSGAWHYFHNVTHQPLEDDDSADSADSADLLITQISAPSASKGEPSRVHSFADGAVSSGQSFELLLGQRILPLAYADHPVSAWCRASDGNYKWTWALGMSLSDEHKYRFGRVSPVASILWTLEAVPPGLLKAPFAWLEPCMPEVDKIVDEEGYYDTPASYRNYCLKSKTFSANWTRRPAPAWFAK